MLLIVLISPQAHSPREQQPKRTRDRGVVYSPLACTDDGDVAVLTSRTAFPTRERETERGECEHEPLLEHST